MIHRPFHLGPVPRFLAFSIVLALPTIALAQMQSLDSRLTPIRDKFG